MRYAESTIEKELFDYCKDIASEIDDIANGDSEKSLHEYFEDALDIRFEVDGRRELCGGKIMVACGGPNIWVHENVVSGYWGAAEAHRELSPAAKDAVFEYLCELWVGC